MEPQPAHTTPNSVTNPTALKNMANLTVTTTLVAVPGHIIRHDKNSVVIGGEKFSEILRQLYESGFRRVEVLIEVARQKIVVEGVIYKKHDSRRGRTHFTLYPLQPGQAVLRMLSDEHRRDAAPYAKKPLPVLIHQIAVPLKPK
jgi:hypothetical protein